VPNAFSEQHLAMLQQLAEFASQIVYAPKTQVEPAKKVEATGSAVAAVPKSNGVATGPAPQKAPEVKVAPPAPKPPEVSRPAAAAAVPSAAAAVAPVVASTLTSPTVAHAKVEEAPAPPRKPSGRIKRAGHSNAATATAPALAKTEVEANSATVLTPEEMELLPKQEPGYRKIIIPLASLLVLLLVLGFWFKSRTPRQTPTSGAGPIVTKNDTLPTPRTEPITVTPDTAGATLPLETSTSSPPKKEVAASSGTKKSSTNSEEEVVDSVRPAPISVAPATSSLRSSTKDDAPVEALPISGVATSSNLASLNLPGVAGKPQLKQTSTSSTGGYPVHQVKPLYPTSAREKRVEGDVVLAVRVLKNGMVGNIRRVSGNPILASAATDAVRRWRYEPYSINGEAQTLDTTITVQFRLPNR
jgi:TonB family protein